MWLFKRRVIHQGAYQPFTVEIKPVDPLLEQLCADIEQRPGAYKRDGYNIVNKTDNALWINNYHFRSCVTDEPNETERARVNSAYSEFSDYLAKQKRADIATSLAAIRKTTPDEHQANLSRAQAGLAILRHHPSCSVAFLCDQAQAVLIPVLAGTHKIVPIDRQWPDKAGQMHATREQARAANRGMRAGAGGANGL